MADDVIREVPSRFPPGTRLIDRLNLEKVSWGAIWAGAMVTIGMELLFVSFGVFIDAVFGGSAAWTMAWYLVTMAVSFYVGARSAARLSDINVREVCVLHGLATWGLATLSTAIIGGVVGYILFINRAPGTTAAWGPTIEWAGTIWGGVILSLATSYFGGAHGLPHPQLSAGEQPAVPSEPLRRVG